MNPKLRPLEFNPVHHDGGKYFHVHDRHGFSDDALLPRDWGGVLGLLDGTRDAAAIVFQHSLQSGQMLSHEFVEQICEQLDDAFLLDSPKFRAHREAIVFNFENATIREPSCAGNSYPADTESLRHLLKGFFEEAKNIAPKAERPQSTQSRGIIVPHIDFTRGGITEALAYENLKDEEFDTFVVLGIAHCGVEYPFCAADKDFATPLGNAECDREFLNDLNARCDSKLLSEQYAHKKEHSIEFVAVFLQYLEQFKNAKIVPIICGGFFEELRSGDSPMENPDIAQFVSALRDTVEEHEARGKRIGFIASVDLAHVGSSFGDERVLTRERRIEIETEDLQFLSCIENGNKDAMHAALAKDNNVRNVDAHPAVYALMAAFPELHANLLDYRQTFDEENNSLVSFAALHLWR